MKKLILNLLCVSSLVFAIVSCSKPIEFEEEIKPSIEKSNKENKGEWLMSIISKQQQNKSARTTSLCANAQFLGDLGTLGCSSQTLNVPANVECGYFTFTAGVGQNSGLGLSGIYSSNYTSSASAYTYIVKEDGALYAYGLNFAYANISPAVPAGTIIYVVYIKTQTGVGNYTLDTLPQAEGTSCSDTW